MSNCRSAIVDEAIRCYFNRRVVPDSVSKPLAAVLKKSVTVGMTAAVVVFAPVLIVPLFAKNFIIFQMTMVMIYAISILALILTRGSGNGQSAFCADLPRPS
jgi:branched-chain amino acid transport system permease protein